MMQNPVDPIPTMLVTRWTPFECSSVSTPADPFVGYQRSLENKDKSMKKHKREIGLTEDEIKKLKDLLAETEDETEEKAEEPEEQAAPTEAEAPKEEEQKAEELEEQKACDEEEKACDTEEEKACDEEEVKKKEACPTCGQDPCVCEEEEIRSLGDLLNKRDMAEDFINNKRSLAEFKDAIRTKNFEHKETKNMEDKKFSLRKALLNATGKMSDEEAKFEREIIAENKRKFNANDADIVLSKNEIRAFNGAEALNQVVYQPGMYTPNLRPPVTVDAIGTRKVSVNGSSISFSVCTSGIAGGYVDINGEVPSATMDFALKTMTPHKAGAYVDVSYQSLLQDDPSAEGIIMDDIVKALDQARDAAFWNGTSGNNEPVGLLNTTGVNEVALTGTLDIEIPLAMEKKIRESYDYSGNLKFCFGTDAYYTWAATPKKTTAVNEFLIDDDRKCLGYDCFVDPNLPASAVVLGNFDEALDAAFDGITIKIVEDAILARKQALEIVAYAANDYLLRRPKSFTKLV
jgi:hypothetical protein